jgi:phosphate transport system permease protein
MQVTENQNAKSNVAGPSWADPAFHFAVRFFAIAVLLLLLGILLSLFVGAWPALQKFGFSFFTSSEWNAVTDEYGAVTPMLGTLITSLIALVIAIPISLGMAVFLTELSPVWLRRPLGTAIELLAAIPSIIYGMWGLFVLAPYLSEHIYPWVNDNLGEIPLVGVFFQGPPLGIGVLTASMILAIMVIPFITSVMRDVFNVVPQVLKESAYGLGATTWEVVWNVVMPYARLGVMGGVLLGLGRALGETMAVTFVIGNAHEINLSLLMPGNTISSTLANEFTEAVGDMYTSSLMALGLVLFFITFVVLALAKVIMLRLESREGK